MDVDSRLSLITRNLSEVVTYEELKNKLESGHQLKGYLGYEPSGLFHIGWLVWAQKVKDLVNAGVKMNLLEATWHAWINDKMGGDLEKIKRVSNYIREILNAYGVENVKFVDAEELVGSKEYWALVVKVTKNTTLARMKRALTIMGRQEEEAELDTSKLIYPGMQVADIMFMDLDIALGGTDQRKAHMLARDVADKMNAKKVIALHTPLLTGLKGGARMEIHGLESDDITASQKMSKSKPEDAIFVHDSPEQVEEKLKRAYCPQGQVEGNPILDIVRYLIFPNVGKFKVQRPQKYGGDVEFLTYEELEKSYLQNKIHPLDLKRSTTIHLNSILDPIRSKIRGRRDIETLITEISPNITR